ncbi:C2H2 type zinc-finger-domain-containing protein [Rhexocercosporidium sp. MPI-PUGE-AT-0058]|nr:C2H2 type zinc-finger-domain-containing protein [Rhexocercosporidium sp. MPI-PUGE-AT-0058]
MSISSTSGYGSGSTKSSLFTCNICEITFENNTLQRSHAKSDWHIYNLKRHLTSLPPISLQVYNDRVASVQETSTAEALETESFYQSCTICVKDFYTLKSFHNHLKSSNHALTVSKLIPKDSNNNQAPSNSETPEYSISSSCLFCPLSSSSLTHNMAHMHTTHAFSIPHQASLFDLVTFIEYLSTLITTFQECVYCGQTRDTTAAIRQHMVDKGHCRLADDAAESEEFEDFFDIADTESDGDDIEGRDNGTSPHVPIPTDTKELHLPSGRTLVHRSKARTSRQNHNLSKISTQKSIESGPSEASSIPSTTPDRRAVMSLQRSDNANKGMIGVPELEKRAVRALEKKMLKMEVRARNVYQARVERGANRQKFFKPDVPGPKNG